MFLFQDRLQKEDLDRRFREERIILTARMLPNKRIQATKIFLPAAGILKKVDFTEFVCMC